MSKTVGEVSALRIGRQCVREASRAGFGDRKSVASEIQMK